MSAPMKLRVRNVLGIKKADLTLHGILLVAGINAAGKSSLLEAAACAVLQTPMARGFTTKKAAGAAILHDGTQSGSIVLDYGPGQVRIAYPEAVVEAAGKPETLGTALGINAKRFMALTEDARVQEVTERFQMAATKADLTEWLRENPGADLTDAALDVFWDDVDTSGWDAVHKRVKEHGTKIKGRWEVYSGRRFGVEIAKNWCPTNLLPDEEYTVAETDDEVEDARGKLEGLMAHAAVGAAERSRLQGLVDNLEMAAAELERLSGEETRLSALSESLLVRRNATGMPIDSSLSPDCPHCGKKVRLKRVDAKGTTILEKMPQPLSLDALKRARTASAELDGDIDHTQAELRGVLSAKTTAHQEVMAANRARSEMQRLQSVPVIDEAVVEAARDNVRVLDAKLDSVKKLAGAKSAYADWCRNEVMVRALDPDGVRRTALNRGLSKVCMLLSDLSEKAGFAEVALTADMGAMLAGRPYALLSESERWRVDLVLAAMFNRQEKARVLLIDRLDVLHPQARAPVFTLLRGLGCAVLIGMTARDFAAVPSLEKAGVGVARWLEKGVLTDPAETAAAA